VVIIILLYWTWRIIIIILYWRRRRTIIIIIIASRWVRGFWGLLWGRLFGAAFMFFLHVPIFIMALLCFFMGRMTL